MTDIKLSSSLGAWKTLFDGLQQLLDYSTEREAPSIARLLATVYDFDVPGVHADLAAFKRQSLACFYFKLSRNKHVFMLESALTLLTGVPDKECEHLRLKIVKQLSSLYQAEGKLEMAASVL
jgi:hypothetical protein